MEPSGGDALFAKIARSWLETTIDVKGSTLLPYKRELRCYVLPMWGGKMLREITISRF